MIITIDGPSGTGKSTIAKQLASQLKYRYCNTGAMYRTLAFTTLQTPWNTWALQQIIDNPPFTFFFDNNIFTITLDTKPLSLESLSNQTIAKTSSILSQKPEVRSFMQKLQRSFAQGYDCIFEGRDMGSKVFPNADLKIFLTANASVRAQRRLSELKDSSANLEKIEKEIRERDHEDSSRENDPLIIPKEAIVIDSSDLTISRVLETILSYIKNMT